jgi:hypothetical protein
MTLCPIALVVSCAKCPVVGYCPLKTLIGDFETENKPKSDNMEDQKKDLKS